MFSAAKAMIDLGIVNNKFSLELGYAWSHDEFDLPLMVFSGFYYMSMIVTVVLLANILIALLSNTFTEVKGAATLEWRMRFLRFVLFSEALQPGCLGPTYSGQQINGEWAHILTKENEGASKGGSKAANGASGVSALVDKIAELKSELSLDPKLSNAATVAEAFLLLLDKNVDAGGSGDAGRAKVKPLPQKRPPAKPSAAASEKVGGGVGQEGGAIKPPADGGGNGYKEADAVPSAVVAPGEGADASGGEPIVTAQEASADASVLNKPPLTAPAATEAKPAATTEPPARSPAPAMEGESRATRLAKLRLDAAEARRPQNSPPKQPAPATGPCSPQGAKNGSPPSGGSPNGARKGR